MKYWSIAFVFLLAGCQEDVQIEDGPLSKRSRKQAERSRQENLDQSRRLSENDRWNEKQDHQIGRNSSLSLEQAQYREYESLMLEACESLAEEQEREALSSSRRAPQIRLTEIDYRRRPRRAVLFQGDYISAELIQKAIDENSTNIRDLDPSDNGIRLVGRKFKKPKYHMVPIVFSGEWIELEAGSKIRTYGRDLIFVAPRIRLAGQIVTTPKKSELNSAGKNGGRLAIYSPCLEISSRAEIDLSGGEPGDFSYKPPKNPKAVKAAIEEAKSRLHVRWQMLPGSPRKSFSKGEIPLARAEQIWNQARGPISRELGAHIAASPPWEGDDHGLNWGIYSRTKRRQVIGVGELEVKVPSLQISAQMQTGFSGELYLNAFLFRAEDFPEEQELALAELFKQIDRTKDQGVQTLNLESPAFRLSQNKTRIKLKTEYELQVSAAREYLEPLGKGEFVQQPSTITKRVFAHLWNQVRTFSYPLPIYYSTPALASDSRFQRFLATEPHQESLKFRAPGLQGAFGQPSLKTPDQSSELSFFAEIAIQAIENTKLSDPY